VVVCPRCAAGLELGALRCRFCGADARHACPSATGIGLHTLLVEDLPPHLARAVEIMDQLEVLSPPFAAWLRSDATSVVPVVPGPVAAEVAALFDELMAISRR
jgi:hypothetical protein